MYDRKLFHVAHGRYLLEPKALSDDDIQQLSLVDSILGDRARARRAGVLEVPDTKFPRGPLPARAFGNWLKDYLAPILATYRHKNNQQDARLDALEQRPQLAYKGVHVDGQAYAEASLVTRDGGLWLAERFTNDRPGQVDSGWRLVVKRGGAS
jgi:hypothetical protein